MLSWRELLSQPARPPVKSRPSLTLFFLLVGAFFLTFVPHVAQMPVWISLVIVLSLTIRSGMEIYRLPLPSTLFCGLMALFLLPAIYIQYSTVFGREAGTAFMAGLLAIKFFELRGPRDISVIIFSSFFVVMSTLLYSQAIELFIYCLIMMWVLTALLVRLQSGDRPEDSIIHMLQRSGFIFLQALPLTLFLFFFFPRFNGKLQMSLNEAVLGLNSTVQPGSISRLAKDDSTAMYVTFGPDNNSIPSTDTMYWRGLVLWDFSNGKVPGRRDGVWSEGERAQLPDSHPPEPLPDTKPVVQEITIYPHFQKWLFALDRPVKTAENEEEPVPVWSIMRSGEIIQLSTQLNGANTTLDHKVRYRVASATQMAPPQERPDDELRDAIQLPPVKLPPAKDGAATKPRPPVGLDIDPDIIALADDLYPPSGDPQIYADNIFSYFRKHFQYTTSPNSDPQDSDWMHTFLFKRKTGFCEHFSSTFAVLMRLKKVPARVVVGYLGAQYNPYDNTYIVYQSNAHAWDEIWIDKKGWVREDPTSVFSTNQAGRPPDAGTQHGDDSSDSADISIQIAHQRFTLLSGSILPSWARRAVIEMQLRRQQIEANWDDWVFSYDPDTQNRLAQALGLGRNPTFWLSLATLLGTATCLGLFRIWMHRRPPPAPVEVLYALFCRNMARRGIPRALWEGPLAYSERAAEAFPEKEDVIRNIGDIVTRTRYGTTPARSEEMKKLEQLLTVITASQAATAPEPRDPHEIS